MAKYIQAYFKSEDDAEGARSSLIPLNLEQLEVGRLSEGIGRNSNILTPLLPITNGTITSQNVGGVGGFTGTMGSAGVVPFPSTDIVDDGDDRSDVLETNGSIAADEYENMKYVLSARVKDSEYDDLVHKLRSQGAYVELLS